MSRDPGRGEMEAGMRMHNDVRIKLWGSLIGAVSWLEDRDVGVFQYSPEFLDSGIQIAPLMMPLHEFPYAFPALPRNTFKGLPGLLADSLPGTFGQAVIDAWAMSHGGDPSAFHAVQRLCYIGSSAMGALEFEPTAGDLSVSRRRMDIARLVRYVNRFLEFRSGSKRFYAGQDDMMMIEELSCIAASARGARPKAILAWNDHTDEFMAGTADAGEGFENWLVKFDGISASRDREPSDYGSAGTIEYAYHLMAVEAGIDMMPCRLHHENGRSHFMTKRFDRSARGGKYHMQSLSAMMHLDYKQPLNFSCEQALQVMRRLGLRREELEQLVLRAMFNVIGSNYDDHADNIAFLMNRRGEWRLSPAFDLTYSYDPKGILTAFHRMSINGTCDEVSAEDLIALASVAGIKKTRAKEMIYRVSETVRRWPYFAEKAGVSEKRMAQIQAHQHTFL